MHVHVPVDIQNTVMREWASAFIGSVVEIDLNIVHQQSTDESCKYRLRSPVKYRWWAVYISSLEAEGSHELCTPV